MTNHLIRQSYIVSLIHGILVFKWLQCPFFCHSKYSWKEWKRHEHFRYDTSLYFVGVEEGSLLRKLVEFFSHHFNQTGNFLTKANNLPLSSSLHRLCAEFKYLVFKYIYYVRWWKRNFLIVRKYSTYWHKTCFVEV